MNRKTVLLVLCRKVIAGLMIDTINRRPDMEAFGVYRFSEAGPAACTYSPHIALLEIPERVNQPALETLDACREIKEASPDCKIILLCPERDKESVSACVAAKKQGKIEDFLFYESSVDYLVSKLESL